MDEKILELLKKYRTSINENQFKDFYEELYRTLIPTEPNLRFNTKRGEIGKLTETLYEAGCDPLANMTYVPRCFLFGSSVDNFTIPSHVSEIKRYAFAYSDLRSIIIPGKVWSVGESAFLGCNKLTRVEVEDGVEILRHDCFAHTGRLKEVILPTSIKQIHYYSFAGSIVQEITYLGTKEQWLKITFDTENANLAQTDIKCTDGILEAETWMEWAE